MYRFVSVTKHFPVTAQKQPSGLYPNRYAATQAKRPRLKDSIVSSYCDDHYFSTANLIEFHVTLSAVDQLVYIVSNQGSMLGGLHCHLFFQSIATVSNREQIATVN